MAVVARADLRIKQRAQDFFLLIRRKRVECQDPRFHDGSAEAIYLLKTFTASVDFKSGARRELANR